jgi:hypothetical protein
MVWVFLLITAIAVGIVLWLAFILIKWLLILAVIAAIVWLVAVWRRRLAH